jgi:hypothetical protein
MILLAGWASSAGADLSEVVRKALMLPTTSAQHVGRLKLMPAANGSAGAWQEGLLLAGHLAGQWLAKHHSRMILVGLQVMARPASNRQDPPATRGGKGTMVASNGCYVFPLADLDEWQGCHSVRTKCTAVVYVCGHYHGM